MKLNEPGTQQQFAELVGLSESRVSQLVAAGVITRGATLHGCLLSYCAHLREVVAGRTSGELGGLDLVKERAALAREHRRSYEFKNAVAEGLYAPTELLAQVLTTVSQAVAEGLEGLPGEISIACPGLPDAARQQLEASIASARSEWIRATERLVVEPMSLDDLSDAEVDVDEGQ